MRDNSCTSETNHENPLICICRRRLSTEWVRIIGLRYPPSIVQRQQDNQSNLCLITKLFRVLAGGRAASIRAERASFSGDRAFPVINSTLNFESFEDPSTMVTVESPLFRNLRHCRILSSQNLVPSIHFIHL